MTGFNLAVIVIFTAVIVINAALTLRTVRSQARSAQINADSARLTAELAQRAGHYGMAARYERLAAEDDHRARRYARISRCGFPPENHHNPDPHTRQPGRNSRWRRPLLSRIRSPTTSTTPPTRS